MTSRQKRILAVFVAFWIALAGAGLLANRGCTWGPARTPDDAPPKTRLAIAAARR